MKKRSQKLMLAKKMPPLQHKLPDSQYDPRKSEVLKWFSEQPALLEYIFETVKNNELVYDTDTGTWVGADYGN